jgi:3-polyprenyl-4-hydroxybenzoate decarboxylase
MPAFYDHPQTIDDLINHSLGRVLDLFEIHLGVVERWAGAEKRTVSPLR